MRFTTTTLLLALAALTIANPLASPVADPVAAPQNTPPPVDKPNCRDCDNFYTKCRSSWACWFNPQACDVSCRADTCRQFDGFCKSNCGYNNC